MRKWVLVLSASVLAFSGLLSPFLVYSSTVFAVSVYDNLIKTTSTLNVTGNTCIPTDVTTTYLSYMLLERPTYLGGSTPSEEQWETDVENLQNAIADGSLIVTQNEDNLDNSVTVWWGQAEDEWYLDWYESGGVSAVEAKSDLTTINNFYTLWATNPNDTGQCEVQIRSYATNQSHTGVSLGQSDNSGGEIETFIARLNHNLPPGYEGLIPPDSAIERIRPDFTYSVNGKTVQAKDYNLSLPAVTPEEGYTIAGYSVEWSLFKCDALDLGVCENPDIVDYQIQPQDNYYNTSVVDYGNYQLQAQYLVQQCYRYPSYPATPDYCFYIDLDVELPDYEFTSTAVDLVINGDTIAGDTRDGECDVSGHCVPPSIYEDCSTYGGEAPFGIGGGSFPDIVGGFTCVIGNFGKWLIESFKVLFIPKASFWQSWADRFGAFLDEKLGFVYTAVAFIVDLLTGIIENISTTSCTLAPEGELFGAEVEFDVCIIEEINPTMFSVIQSLIIGITVIGLYFAGLHKYHQVLEQR